MKKVLSFSCAFIFPALMLVTFAHAQGQIKGLVSPVEFKSIKDILNALFGIIVNIGAVAVTLAIIYSGFLFVMARGNQAELQKAKTTFFWTVIGGLILLGAQVISNALHDTITTLK